MKKPSERDHNQENKGRRKRPQKAVYQRDPDKPGQAPRKPLVQVHSKRLSIRFTQAEWASIQQLAQRAGTTPTAVVRAAVLGERLPAVVTRDWTAAERSGYRTLVNKFNALDRPPANINGGAAAATAVPAIPAAEAAEIRDLLRQLLAAIVPPQTGQNRAGV